MNNKYESLLKTLEKRFEDNMHRHPNYKWEDVYNLIKDNVKALKILSLMEETGGEPDLVELNLRYQDLTFVDCSKESPVPRRGLCYDKKAFDKRKNNKPKGDAFSLLETIGSKMLNEFEYIALQNLEVFDLKSSSWLLTEDKLRNIGGAIFGEVKFNRTFISSNGAESYYSTRGFRTILKVEIFQ